MCEAKIDWTKPVEIVYPDGEIKPVEVLWYDERYPNEVMITWGDKLCACQANCYIGNCYLRNTPPPPPSIYVVWKKDGTGALKYWCRLAQEEELADGFYMQKVTCDAPDLR